MLEPAISKLTLTLKFVGRSFGNKIDRAAGSVPAIKTAWGSSQNLHTPKVPKTEHRRNRPANIDAVQEQIAAVCRRAALAAHRDDTPAQALAGEPGIGKTTAILDLLWGPPPKPDKWAEIPWLIDRDRFVVVAGMR